MALSKCFAHSVSFVMQGFSGQLFPLYYDSGTWNPYQKAQQVKVEFSARNKTAAEAMFIAFPAMRTLAQKHFGCSSLPGAPADVGSLASHFKQRLFGVSVVVAAAVTTARLWQQL